MNSCSTLSIEETKILLIPTAKLREWLNNYPSLNFYAFEMFNKRYLDLIETIDQLIFNRLDKRLYLYLKGKVLLSKKISKI